MCNATRQGNAIVLAMGVIAVAAALLATSATSAVSQNAFAQQRVQQIDALAAVEAVLSRRESLVLQKANDGTLFTWTGNDGQDPNFGEEFFGDCTVRWKIEPARTVRAADIGQTDDALSWIENPPPDVEFTAADPAQQQNDFVYLFRIAADAWKPGSGQFESTRAQGVRYVSINQEPLFRYVIFYAARGPKGDLELSHRDDLTIEGGVHSNGAIYIGSSTLVNNFHAARLGPEGRTQIGPVAWRDLNENGSEDPGETNLPVRINGVDGIFALSKPLMFGALNSLPVANEPSGWSITDAYDARDDVAYPRDAVAGVDAAQLANIGVVGGVRGINPYRVLDDSGFIALNQSIAVASRPQARTINDANSVSVPFLGVGIGTRLANDARDGALVGQPSRWRDNSLSSNDLAVGVAGFGGNARTNETGGRIKRIPKELAGTEDLPLRPLEAQKIEYADFDGDPTTDQHELARPVFLRDGEVETFNPAESATDFLGRIIEVPGKYLSLALRGEGGGVFMARRTDGTGWDVVNQAGAAWTPGNDVNMGIVIRERPIPDIDIWPATQEVPALSSADPGYLPYAYGKHLRLSKWPFFIADVSDGVYPNAGVDAWDNWGLGDGGATLDNINATNNDLRAHSYAEGGLLTIRAANSPGPHFPDGFNDNNAGNGGYLRKPYFYNENWRFVHLKQPRANPTRTAGLNMKVFKDSNPEDQSLAVSAYRTANDPWYNLLGTPNKNVAQSAITSLTKYTDLRGTGTTAHDYLSYRYEAFLQPQYNESYDIVVDRVDDGVRVWLDGRLISHPSQWRNGGGRTVTCPTPILDNSKGYHLVVDYYEDAGGEDLRVRWRSPSRSLQNIPTGSTAAPFRGFYRQDPDVGYTRSAFESAQFRIDTNSLAGPDAGKVALMLRNGSAGLSPLLSGRDRYIAICYSPSRGFFAQYRLEAAKPQPTDLRTPLYFIGKGTYTQAKNSDPIITGAANGAGVVTTIETHDGTLNVHPNDTYVYTNYTRDARVSRADRLYSYGPTEFENDSRAGPTDTRVTITSTVTLDPGDGSGPRTGYFGLAGGVASAEAEKGLIPIRKAAKDGILDVDLDLSGADGLFINDDVGRRLDVYNLTATATTTGLDDNLSGNIQQVRNGGSQVRLRYTAEHNWANDRTAINEGPEETRKVEIGSNWVFTDSEALVTTMINMAYLGRTDWVRKSSSHSSYQFDAGAMEVRAQNPATVTTPPNPTAPDWTNGLDQWNDTNGRSFRVNRATPPPGSTSALHDVNAYQSADGFWMDPQQRQYLPWNPIWETYTMWTWASTHSYRPDLWYGDVPPTSSADTPKSLIMANDRWIDDMPNRGDPTPGDLGPQIVLRLEKQAGDMIQLSYYSGTNMAPTPAMFTTIMSRDTLGTEVPLSLPIGTWEQLLIGPAVQSGDSTQPLTVTVQDISIELSAPSADYSDANDDGVVNKEDWDDEGGVASIYSWQSRYLASQYQVFFGPYDITEDFFTYLDGIPNGSIATEDWFYSPREFWSQSRTWDHGAEKDGAGTTYAGHNNFINRLLTSKTTVLSINMGQNTGTDLDPDTIGTQMEGLQGYLKARTLTDAAKLRITDPAGTSPVTSTTSLAARFNGLIHISRTNRYPKNPYQDSTMNNGENPYSFDFAKPLPNRIGEPGNPDGIALNETSMPGFEDALDQHLLQPYPLAEAPAFRPQHFHHGVRIWNASDFHWGYGPMVFGNGKTSVVTPNQLYLHGDVNTRTYPVTTPRTDPATADKITPVAFMGDVVHLLSNSFDIKRWQIPGISVTAGGAISGSGVLRNPTQFAATTTTYNTCILTHNRPTTRLSVQEGQGAAFIDTLQFMENWNGRTMSFTGSLVVMDSRRYTDGFLLDSDKLYGRSVFGTLISNDLSPGDRTAWAAIHGASQWTGKIPRAYTAGGREFTFNDDLLTQEGTPPFTPFGLTVSGLGGWSRIIQ